MSLPAGIRLPIGPDVSTVCADIDMETYSEAGYVWNEEANKWDGPPGASGNKKGLPVVGLDNYAKHPTAAILMFAYDLKEGRGWRVWLEGMPFPDDLRAHIAAGRLLEAHNSGFEQRLWKHVGVAKYGWPEMPDAQWRCSAAKARAYALPGSLANVGEVLNLDIQKDKAGKALMTKFSMPRKPTKTDPRRRVLLLWSPDPAAAAARYHPVDVSKIKPKVWEQDHEDSLAYLRYCIRDIETESEVSQRCPDLVGEELAWWQFGQLANERGVHINRKGLDDCIEIVEQCLSRYNAELRALTNIDSASKVQQILEWLRGKSLFLDSLDEEAVEKALTLQGLDPLARRVLEIRAAAGSASVKKVFAIRNGVSSDDRLRDLYVVNGARTGRDIGQGAQPANLPSAGPAPYKCQCGTLFAGSMVCPSCRTPLSPTAKEGEWSPVAAEQALRTIASRSLAEVERVWGVGNALKVVAGCLRALFDAAPGCDLISSDYNSVEAVAIAMVSGEKWRVDTFNSHGKIYEASAAEMFGVPFSEFMATRGYTPEQMLMPEWWTLDPANPGQHHKLRKLGKIGELAFGFQGWLGSAKAFGMPGADEEIKENILAWRAASPCIPWLWGGQTARKASEVIRNASRPGYAGTIGPGLSWLKNLTWEQGALPFRFGAEGAFADAIQGERGVEFKITRLDGSDTGFSYARYGKVIWAKLPSGRFLKYHNAVLYEDGRICYDGWNTNPKNGPIGWITMDTWGGRLVENLIQAICRDILRSACLSLEAAGYPVVLRTYDEVVSEVPLGFGSHEEFERIVETRPPWARDWPIRAPGSWRGGFYRKA